MTRLNFVLLSLLVACALSVVTSQHKARRQFTEWQEEQDKAKQIEVEWGQLQLEQSTWATRSRVERIATQSMQMRLPDRVQTRVVDTAAARTARR
jgi:cell division protein FtsL